MAKITAIISSVAHSASFSPDLEFFNRCYLKTTDFLALSTNFFNVDISLLGTEELATQVISCTNFGTLIESEFEKNGRRRNRNGRREGD